MFWLPYSPHTSHHPSQTPCLPWISYATQKLMLHYARWSKSSLKHSIRFCDIFSKFKTEFYCISFFKVSDCIFEIHQLWQSGFSRVYSICCCSCSFEREIIRISQSSHKMYSNNILNFQESTIFTQPLRSGRIWQNANFFKRSLTSLYSEFSFS